MPSSCDFAFRALNNYACMRSFARVAPGQSKRNIGIARRPHGPSTTRSDELPAWFSFWFSGRWRGRLPPTKARRRPGRVYCAIYHHRRSSASSSFHVAQPWHKTTKSQAPTDRPGYVLHLGGGASTTGQSFCSCDLALTLVSSTRTTVHFHRPTKFQTLNRSAENPPHRRLRSIMVHGTKLVCDLARHLPIHCSGDSAAPRGGTSGVVLFGSAGRL